MAPHKLQNSWVIWEIKEKQGNADVRKAMTWEYFATALLLTFYIQHPTVTLFS
jgi:hypothetical protein